MLISKTFSITLVFTCVILHFVHAHVPVFLWSDNANLEAPPTQISDVKFENYLKNVLESSHSKLLGFVLPSLSMEDLSVTGKEKLPNLDGFLENAVILPAISSPSKTLDKLKAVHVSQPAKLLQALNKNDVVLVNFDMDTTQDRTSYMQHIDKLIGQYMKQIASYKENVINLFTGESPSWDLTNDHQSMGRHLLDASDVTSNTSESESTTIKTTSSTTASSTTTLAPSTTESLTTLEPIYHEEGTFYDLNYVLLHLANVSYYKNDSKGNDLTKKEVKAIDCEKNDTLCNILISTFGDEFEVDFNLFFNSSLSSYWLETATATVDKGTPLNLTLGCGYVQVPRTFSFSCDYFVMKPRPGEEKYTFLFQRFQIELFVTPSSERNDTKFKESFDCEPFITVPIFMGLFVGIFLTTILAVGIYVLLSLKTPDRFDDPKSKLALIISPAD